MGNIIIIERTATRTKNIVRVKYFEIFKITLGSVFLWSKR